MTQLTDPVEWQLWVAVYAQVLTTRARDVYDFSSVQAAEWAEQRATRAVEAYRARRTGGAEADPPRVPCPSCGAHVPMDARPVVHAHVDQVIERPTQTAHLGGTGE